MLDPNWYYTVIFDRQKLQTVIATKSRLHQIKGSTASFVDGTMIDLLKVVVNRGELEYDMILNTAAGTAFGDTVRIVTDGNERLSAMGNPDTHYDKPLIKITTDDPEKSEFRVEDKRSGAVAFVHPGGAHYILSLVIEDETPSRFYGTFDPKDAYAVSEATRRTLTIS